MKIKFSPLLFTWQASLLRLLSQLFAQNKGLIQSPVMLQKVFELSYSYRLGIQPLERMAGEPNIRVEICGVVPRS